MICRLFQLLLRSPIISNNSYIIRLLLCILSYCCILSKASYPHSAIQCFLFQYPVFSFFPQGHPVAAYVFFTVFLPLPSITCFKRRFLGKMRPIQLAFHSSWTLCNTSFFSSDRSNWFSPSFSSTIFRNIPDISDLIYEVSKFQDHTKLRSKCCKIITQV